MDANKYSMFIKKNTIIWCAYVGIKIPVVCFGLKKLTIESHKCSHKMSFAFNIFITEKEWKKQQISKHLSKSILPHTI